MSIQLTGIAKRFGDFVAVDHVDLEIATGELLALGFSDAMNRRDEVAAFLSGDSAGFLPLLPPELLN